MTARQSRTPNDDLRRIADPSKPVSKLAIAASESFLHPANQAERASVRFNRGSRRWRWDIVAPHHRWLEPCRSVGEAADVNLSGDGGRDQSGLALLPHFNGENHSSSSSSLEYCTGLTPDSLSTLGYVTPFTGS